MSITKGSGIRGLRLTPRNFLAYSSAAVWEIDEMSLYVVGGMDKLVCP